ncbi:hypothetical protein SFRURICE_003137, partial [Spodoptera frugiperda]
MADGVNESPLSSAPNTPPSEKKTEEEEGPPAGGKKGMKGLEEDDEADKKDQKDAGYVEDSETEEMREEERANWKSNPTVKPLRVNCSPPAIEQFPKPLMGQSARKHGGLIIHILVAVFTFIGLAIVCDEYFVSRVSGVIGSAVFNIMFVISVCALCAGTVSHLNWWPLCRDCFFYAISILVMLCTIANSIVSWYIVWRVCVALRLSTASTWAMTSLYHSSYQTQKKTGCFGYLQQPRHPGAQRETPNITPDGTDRPRRLSLQEISSYPRRCMQTPIYNAQQAVQQTQQQPHEQQPAAPAYYKAKEYNPETAVDPLVKPIGANHFQLAWWYLVFPIHWSCRHTMPDCRGRWYPVTFIISMLWISFYSYF